MYGHKLYVVTWLDAWSNTSSYYKDDGDYSPMEMVDVGYMMEENDETLVLCSQLTKDGGARHHMVIPWEYIVKIEELT